LPQSERWTLDGGFVCEEWLDGPVLSVEVALLGSNIVAVTSALGTQQVVEPCVGYGSVIPVLGSDDVVGDCVEYAKRVCGSVSPTFGVWDIELIVTRKGPMLVEVNPRRMGGRMLAAYNWATGGRFEDVVLDTYSGRHPTVTPSQDRVVVIRKLLPLDDGRVSASWNPTPMFYSDQLQFVNYDLAPGAQVRRMQVLGRLLVRSTEARLAFARADHVMEWLEERSGLRLVRGTLPTIPERRWGVSVKPVGEP
jgi:hypothetical protein